MRTKSLRHTDVGLNVEKFGISLHVRVQIAALTYMNLRRMIMVWDASRVYDRSVGLTCPLRWRVHGTLAYITLLC